MWTKIEHLNNLQTRKDVDWNKENLHSCIEKLKEEFDEVMEAWVKYVRIKSNSDLQSFFEHRDELAQEIIDIIRASLSSLYHLGYSLDRAWQMNLKKNEGRK